MFRRCLLTRVAFTPLMMPALSPSMETGTLVKWNVQPGSKIESGTSLCMIQTDKANVSFDNQLEEGYFAKAITKEGESVTVGGVIGVMVEEEEDVTKADEYQPPAAAKAEEPPKKAEAPPPPPPPPAPEKKPAPASTGSSSTPTLFGGSLEAAIHASGPAIHRIADEVGIEKFKGITPTGKDGRFTKGDLTGVAPSPAAAAESKAAPGAPSASGKSQPGSKNEAPWSVPLTPTPVVNFHKPHTSKAGKGSEASILASLVAHTLRTAPKPKPKKEVSVAEGKK